MMYIVYKTIRFYLDVLIQMIVEHGNIKQFWFSTVR